MRLSDLDPQFIGTGGEGVTNTATGEPVPFRPGVGVGFDCPCGCGSYRFVPFANPLDGGAPVFPDHGWQRDGDTFDTLTLSPSILFRTGCGWHGYIRGGQIVNA